MRRNVLGVGLISIAVLVGCRSTKIDPTKYAAIETDPRGAPPVAPAGPGDVSRKFTADRGRVAKAVFRQLSPGVTSEGDFAIDEDRGPLPLLQKSSSVESRVRTIRGRGPGGHFVLVEIRPEGTDTLAIVRGTPKADEAVSLVLLDKVEEELKGGGSKTK